MHHASTGTASRPSTAPARQQRALRTGFVAAIACSLGMLMIAGPAKSATRQCSSDSDASPQIHIATSAGDIGIRLNPDAAPDTVDGLLALIRQQFAAEKAADSDQSANNDFTIAYTRPHIEIRTSQLSSTGTVFTQEIDAHALGLDKARIDSPGEAMNAIQDELLPAYRKARRTGSASAQLENWIAAWYDNYKADFLVGVSRQQINEALGHSYAQGLASRPVSKGTVALKPSSAQLASPVLSIALADLPQRTGKWMVVGQVTQGLEVAERISLAPLDRPHHVRSRTYHPRDPVVIESIRMECG